MWRSGNITRLASLLFSGILLQAQPARVLEDWKKDPALKGASYAFCVSDARSGSVITEYNADLSLIPASTQKIFTTAGALEKKGTKFRYETTISYEGTFDKVTGVLNGDLIINGSGDPSLQSAYFGKNRVTDEWAAALVKSGLKKITGSVLSAAGVFPREVQPGWLWEDVSNYYGSSACGLNYMDNRFSVYLKSGPEGSPVTIAGTEPQYACCNYSLQCGVVAGGSRDEAYAFGDPFAFSRRITGTIPPQKEKYEIEVALPDPALLCAEQLLQSLLSHSVDCSGSVAGARYDKLPSSDPAKVIYRHYSPELEKIVYYTNQNSNNMYCESLVQLMAPGAEYKCLFNLRKWLKTSGIDTTVVRIQDACGLSRLNTCTARSEVQLLNEVSRKDYFAAFEASLPLAGRQGSLANIGKGTRAENNLRAKSGYMEGARAYCGYVRNKAGRLLSFSVILNNYNCKASEAKQKLEKFLVAVAEL